ncbi:hypothetical protein ES708_20877 [subsurface metagenome]
MAYRSLREDTVDNHAGAGGDEGAEYATAAQPAHRQPFVITASLKFGLSHLAHGQDSGGAGADGGGHSRLAPDAGNNEAAGNAGEPVPGGIVDVFTDFGFGNKAGDKNEEGQRRPVYIIEGAECGPAYFFQAERAVNQEGDSYGGKAQGVDNRHAHHHQKEHAEDTYQCRRIKIYH